MQRLEFCLVQNKEACKNDEELWIEDNDFEIRPSWSCSDLYCDYCQGSDWAVSNLSRAGQSPVPPSCSCNLWCIGLMRSSGLIIEQFEKSPPTIKCVTWIMSVLAPTHWGNCLCKIKWSMSVTTTWSMVRIPGNSPGHGRKAVKWFLAFKTLLHFAGPESCP